MINLNSGSREPFEGMTFADTIARNVRTRRVALELTQQELARRARVSLRTVNEVERAHRAMPKMVTIERLAKALECSAREIMVMSVPSCEVCGATCPTCASRVISARIIAAAASAP